MIQVAEKWVDIRKLNDENRETSTGMTFYYDCTGFDSGLGERPP
jgi:hypothetical protein